jgi:hypothetical protein
MKQTAVEWLANEIASRITRRNPHDTIIIQTQGEILIELIEQAKAMEREQIIDAYKADCDTLGHTNAFNAAAEQYYNKSFKSE